ncbi:MAG TPA: 4-alpha-glucanotransferase [Candidatus Cybelea sp.]|nr:4-alpha-glucanotransferase [Candidatus Cybelea sp.]
MNPPELIEPSYLSYWGERIETREETRRALLDAMGNDPVTLSEPALSGVEGKRDKRLPPVIVIRQGATPQLPPGVERWSLELEGGEEFGGELAELPLGYHRLHSCGDSCALIVTPPQCYLPPSMRSGRIWALSTQLYALRSEGNWGIGDFSDLAQFARLAGRAGASAVGLNPLHALHPSNPAAASPYSPSSRLFFNVLYIDVAKVAKERDSAEIQAELVHPEFLTRLEALRRAPFVDYSGVTKLKLAALERVHEIFRARRVRRSNERRARAFRRFVRAGGTALERLAIYEAMAEFFYERDPAAYGWQQWPADYRSPHSPAVAQFAQEHRERVEFYLHLQWIARGQLSAAAQTARAAGTRLYCDLAVGVEHNGADAWANQDVLLEGASLGAPPDPLNRDGQNWGLAPFSPIALRARAYRPFIDLLRANMRYAGILRIDHVMALRRAFWIPRGAPASQGAYVRYPFDEMLAIVALESVRNRCAVVGEDLGTVPEGFRERMEDAGALSSRVLYFQRDWKDASFLAPCRYPRLAAASIGTHDLPTLAGWWTGDRGDREDRARDRNLLVDALERAGAVDAAASARLRDDAAHGGTLSACGDLAQATHRFLAKTPSAMAVVAIEDVLNEPESVNVPGTFDEHPNWQRKRSLTLEEIDDDSRLWQTGRVMERR